MTLNEIREQRAELIKQARDLDAKAKAENRSLTEDEVSQVDNLLAEFDNLEAAQKRAEKLEAAEREVNTVAERRSEPLDTKKTVASTPEDREQAAWESFIRTGENRDIVLGTTTKGGNFVAPVQVADRIIQKRKERSFVREGATVHTVGAAVKVGVPRVTADIQASFGTSEVAEASEDTNLNVGRIEMEPILLKTLVKASKVSLESDPNIGNFIEGQIGKAFANTEQQKFLVGTGTNEPLGMFVADANGVPTSRDVVISSGTTGLHTAPDKLISMVYTLEPQYRDGAVWAMHPDHAARIRKLKDADGRYLWVDGLGGNSPTLLGYPVNESSYAPNSIASGAYACILYHPEEYHIADRDIMEIQRLEERYAEKSEIGFVARTYVNGNPGDQNAFVRGKLDSSVA